ncbi:hypothetical protein IWQ62_001991 [Dispira parvispora]|uniref:Uncharacterized protein n=1 Tax=Dispira parvispora TaxID=1520584 RepID=A0A9W8AX27_9FUNG|nr:hypothetical protein IWQ62_001991 [Dispira parvispora]
MDFPPFTNIDEFKQTVNQMDLPGEPLTPDVIELNPKDYRSMLNRMHGKYSELSKTATPDSSVVISGERVHRRLAHRESRERSLHRSTLFEHNRGGGYKPSAAISQALRNPDAIVVIYCKKSDVNTYFEVIWYPRHPEYSAERLLAYTMRRYANVKPFSIKTDGDYANFLTLLKNVIKHPSADICSEFVGDPSTFSNA